MEKDGKKENSEGEGREVGCGVLCSCTGVWSAESALPCEAPRLWNGQAGVHTVPQCKMKDPGGEGRERQRDSEAHTQLMRGTADTHLFASQSSPACHLCTCCALPVHSL